MGKRDKRKDKKKGKGAEKTAMKTEKKAAQKLKKELGALGETDIKELISQIREQDRKRTATTVLVTTEPPSRRSNFSLTAHTEKDELILFGGEYFNGSKTVMYNDLFIYNIKKKEWSQILCPETPTPRSSHQAVFLSQAGGQLWVFGGEFDSPSQSQFHHYKDLWVFHLQGRKWEKIPAPGGPSSRSGHRMVAMKKKLFVFGGFHDNTREFKYFNDVHMFNVENYTWTKLEPTGIAPSPRSNCQMLPMLDGRLFVYGGYSKEKVKKDVDKGQVHTDMFYLTPDKNDETMTKWKWASVKQSGLKPSPRCGFSMVASGNDNAVLFGGVFDEDQDENLQGEFYGDSYRIELDKGKWYPIKVSAKKEQTKGGEGEISMETLGEVTTKTLDDGIFTVSVGPSSNHSKGETASTSSASTSQFSPKARMNAGLAFRKGKLYLFGGTCEDGDKQLTFADFYVLDIHKLESWETIVADDIQKQEWVNSDSSSDESDDSMNEDDEEEEEESETDDSDSDDMACD